MSKHPTKSPGGSTFVALLPLRIAWFVFAEAMAVMTGIMIYLATQSTLAPIAEISPVGLIAIVGGCLLLSILAISTRNSLLKRFWKNHAVTTRGYYFANITGYSICMFSVIVGFILFVIYDRHWLYLSGPVIPLLTVLLLWPNGRALAHRSVEI